jgi:hypothetical protein
MPITRRRRANPPEQPENNNHIAEQPVDTLATEQAPSITKETFEDPPAPLANGDRVERTERPERIERQERQDYAPYPTSHQVEGGRRTARGELFRRAPMPPQSPPQPPASSAYPQAGGPQAPTHEISLPLGNLLHLAYNPGYTGSDEARNLLLKQLTDETRAGGRARCWNCGSIAIAYDRWNTRSKTFGEIGIAFCEICGVWSVL